LNDHSKGIADKDDVNARFVPMSRAMVKS